METLEELIKNKIEDVANHYAEENSMSIEDQMGDTYDGIEELSDAYKAGAKWAVNELLKDLWHPASEEPDVRRKTIICLYEDGHICQDYDVSDEATRHDRILGMGEFNWDYYAEDNEIKKWCYETDLL